MDFPKTLLVTRERPTSPRDEPFLIAHENGIGDLDANRNGEVVAVYRLETLNKLAVSLTLAEAKKRKPRRARKAKAVKKKSKR